MTVFKTFLQILKKNKGLVIMYTVILLVFGNINMQSNEKSMSFEASKPNVIIVNQDKEEGITEDLIKYVKQNCEIAEVEDNEDARDDALFYEDASLILYIPQNYNADFLSGKNPEIKIKKSTNYYASFAEMMLQRYVKIAKIYQENITDETQLITKINETLNEDSKTELMSKLDTTNLSRASRYFNFASYSFLACLIYVICLILATFKEENVNKRTIISSFSYKKHNRILLLSNMLYSFILWLLYVVMSFVLIGDIMTTVNGMLMIVNSLVFVIFATALSFFIGNLVKNKNAIGGIVNVIALGSSFLCGAFVPSEWLPDFVKNISRILPTYYYINANDALTNLEEINMDTLMPIFTNMGIVLGFAVVFIVLSNIVSKKKRKIG